MLLRMRAVDIVEDAGFSAVEAINADDALTILESRSDIELLFTDIQMPGSMDGLKLAHAVHERWPLIKIILVSGQLKLTECDKPPDSLFFGKPLGVKQMIAEMQEMMGQRNVENRIRRNFHADREGTESGRERQFDPAGINFAGSPDRGK